MKFQKLILALALGIFANSAIGDDTDIYLNTGNSGSAPYLMLTFDYRTDMTATYCGGGGGGSKKKTSPSKSNFYAPKCNLVTGKNCSSSAASSSSAAPTSSSSPTTSSSASVSSDGSTVANADCAATLADSPELLSALTDLVGSNSADNLDATLAVFKVVFAKFDGINVGLMMNNDVDGGTILRGYKEFQANDANGAKQELIDILASIPRSGNGANFFHEVSPKETHYELYRYLNGGPVLFGTSTASNFSGTHTPDYDASIISGSNYISPFSDPNQDFSCTKLYEVYATSGNAGNNKDSDADSHILSDMNAAATDSQFSGMVDYMTNNDLVGHVDGDQKLKTWFIQMGTAATRVDEWADAAGTADQLMIMNHKEASLVDVQKTLEAAFIEALSVSSTFVSASVPVNVFNRIQTLDNFYIALFEASSTERWNGNVKKLKMSDTSNPADGTFDDIVDANGLSAFNDSDGRIKYEALTFWTDANNLSTADPDLNEVDGRDGRTVNRGGAGQRIPESNSSVLSPVNTTNSRQLYVEPSNGSTFLALDATDATAAALQTLLGAATTDEAKELIKWARGIDVDNEDADNSSSDARPWLLGDAIHSRPLAINYGAQTGYSESSPQIRLFMGTNDGFFHIFENTQNGSESGEEIFAFMPRESLGIISSLRSNLGANTHPYGVDGAPVALVNDTDNDGTIESGEEVYVYVGMRRGGNSYYALDVSNPNATPSLKWKITQGGDFSELGMTFSTPVVTKVRYESTARDVLIFGGGFDTQNDTPVKLSENPSSALQGAAIYIVDARTGALIWKVTGGSGSNSQTHLYHSKMLHSIPSQVAALDSDQNGITDRLYVGDLSGLVWRIDLPEGNTASHRLTWQASVLADLDDNSEAEDRRMFHAPDVVQSKDDQGSYDGILIATGDRANPLETTDENFMFFIKDRNTVSGSPDTSIPFEDDNIVDVTACVTGAESGCGLLNLQNGWKISLSSSGEKGLASPLVAAGKVFFTSYEPSNGSSCEPAEGSGQLYVVNLKDGTAAYSTLGRPIDIGPGIPPAVTAIGNDTLIIPSAGIVKLEQDVPSNDKTKLIEAGGKPMHIIYWRETGIDDL